MQALAPKPKIEETLAPAAESVAQISLRAVAGLEVASVVASVLLTVWLIIPLQPQQRWLTAIPGLLALALVMNSHRVRGERFSEIGFSRRYFGRAFRLVALPTLLACTVFAAIGYSTGSFHRTSHFWSSLLVLPVWAVIQQYVLQAFIYRRMRFVFAGNAAAPDEQRRQANLAILATAAVFALTHAPNLALMLLTLIGALLWCWVYERAPNLWALGLSHAVISLMLMTSLPPWLLPSMSVGYKHFLYQKF
jgi:membrane protease YdiL (CAAX protease family)